MMTLRWRAVEIAGVSWAHMRDILLERGIQPKLGPTTTEEAQQEVDALHAHVPTQP
jgi:predicted HTH domain antitoxin